MPARPPSLPKGMRATLGLALVLTLFGSCGVANGIGQLSMRGPPSAPSMTLSRLQTREVSQLMARMSFERPMRRPLAAANIVVSVMLLLGGTMLVLRKQAAPWWITQAVIANVLWTIGDAASQIVEVTALSPKLIHALEAAATAAAKGAKSPGAGWVAVATLMGAYAARALVMSSIYVWMAWRARRTDVVEFLAEGPGPGPRPPRMP